MIDFYRVWAPNQPPGTIVVVADDQEAEILLRWVPNTGLWQRAHSLENDFLFGDDGGVYEPISADEAAELIHQVKRYDERYDAGRRQMAQYRAMSPEEQRTNAEMGLSQRQTHLRPMRAKGLLELLRRSRRWRTLATYGKEAGSAPREFVSRLRRKSLPMNLEVRVTSRNQHQIVQAKSITTMKLPPSANDLVPSSATKPAPSPAKKRKSSPVKTDA